MPAIALLLPPPSTPHPTHQQTTCWLSPNDGASLSLPQLPSQCKASCLTRPVSSLLLACPRRPPSPTPAWRFQTSARPCHSSTPTSNGFLAPSPEKQRPNRVAQAPSLISSLPTPSLAHCSRAQVTAQAPVSPAAPPALSPAVPGRGPSDFPSGRAAPSPALCTSHSRPDVTQLSPPLRCIAPIEM